MIDTEKIQKDFPQLRGREYHYCDAASTSLTPQSVLDAEIDYYTNNRASVHRGLFKEAVRATEIYEEARNKVARFINADPSEIIFTSGATEGSNMLIRMLEDSGMFSILGKENVELVTTIMEHHGALIPIEQLAMRREIPLHVIPLRGVELDYQKAEEVITERTAVLSTMLASNVTGTINDVRRLSDIAHRFDTFVIADATAAAGHIAIDVAALGCDALFFSGHKMLAPTGVGVLWVKKAHLKKLPPSIFGGHMIDHKENGKSAWADIPSRFEAGTKNISGVLGLGAAIDYINATGIEKITDHVSDLVLYATTRLLEIPGIKVISEKDPAKNVGIVSFVCEFAHPHDVAEILARDHVAVRAGHHCAIPYHGAMGIESSIRASFHCYNTKEDVDALVVALKKTKEIFA